VSRRRTERLVNLVICLLATRRFLTAEQIGRTVPGYAHDEDDPREHEAFQRRFERDKAELRDLGVPLETGTTSVFDTEPGYRIARRDYALPEIHLEPDEAAAVTLAARLWQNAGLASSASSALLKLRAAGVEVDPQATLGIEPVVSAEPSLEPLLAAVHARQAVRFPYRAARDDRSVRRSLEPWGVVCWRGRWYAVGHDLDRGATRCFRLSRVAGEVRTLGEPGAFVPPEDVDLVREVAAFSLAGQGGGRGTATVRLRPGAAAGLRRHAAPAVAPGAPHGAAADPDVLALPYSDAASLAARLAGYGADVVVLDPPAVRDAVVRRLAAMAARPDEAR